jgi:putative transposase
MTPVLILGQTLELNDGLYTLEARLGSLVRIQRDSDGLRETTSVSGLVARLCSPPAWGDERYAPDVLDTLSKDGLTRVERLEPIVRKLLGRVDRDSDGQDVFDRYDSDSTTSTERLRCMVAELIASGRPMSESNLRKLRDDYLASGVAALRDERRDRPADGLSRCPTELRQDIIDVLAQYTESTTPNLTKLVLEVQTLARGRGHAQHLRGTRTLERYVTALNRPWYTTASARTRMTNTSIRHRSGPSRPASYPGQEVQVDTSPWDFFVANDNGKPVRARLTIMVCKHSHSIAGWTITIGDPKGVDIAMMLAESATTIEERPNRGSLPWRIDWQRYPWAKDLSAEDLERHLIVRPQIVTRRIVVDNAKAMLANVVTHTCEFLGVDRTRAHPATPTDKAIVERIFRTIRTSFIQFLPGYVGPGVEHRGKHPERDTLLDIPTVIRLFEYWVAVIYQNRVQKNLIDSRFPKQRKSPNQVVLESYEDSPSVPVPISMDTFIEFMPTTKAQIASDGLHVGHLVYDNQKILGGMRYAKEPRTGKKAWIVHRNPRNPGAVWIRDPAEGGKSAFIPCALQNGDRYHQPYDDTVRRDAQQIVDTYGPTGLEPQRALEMTYEIIGRTVQARESMLRAQARDKTNLEMAHEQGIHMPVPAAVAVEPDDDVVDIDAHNVRFDPKKVWE